MAKSFDLLVCGSPLFIRTENGGGVLDPGLPREICPSCGQAECVNECDGSQGADENNDETEEDAVDRQRYNAFIDAIESVVLAHAVGGVNVSDPKYVQGLETALQAAGRQFSS